MKQFLLGRWFLILLVAALVLGGWQWERLLWLAELRSLRFAVVAGVLFLMALPLETSVIRRVFARPLAPALGVFINIGLLPLFAWGAALALPDELARGLLVAAATPCTLASASVWTRRAGGNDAIATMVTVVSSLLCFVATPLWLWVMTGRQVRSQALDPLAMTAQLALLVVLPMALAQVLRMWVPLGEFATRRKTALGALAQFGVLTMVLFGAIKTGEQLAEVRGRPLLFDFALMLAAVLGTHLAMFFAGLWLGRLLRLPREERIAVAFSGSQKTLMVGLQVSLEIGASVLPMVCYHVGQLLVDTLLADSLRRRGKQQHPEKDPGGSRNR